MEIMDFSIQTKSGESLELNEVYDIKIGRDCGWGGKDAYWNTPQVFVNSSRGTMKWDLEDVKEIRFSFVDKDKDKMIPVCSLNELRLSERL